MQDREKPGTDAAGAFAAGLTGAVAQPIDGAAELLGAQTSRRQLNREELDPAAKAAHDAGAMLGSAAVFIGTTAIARKLFPGAGRVAPISAGAALGFVAPTENGSLAERIQHAAIGAGTVGLLEYGPVGLNKFAPLQGRTLTQLGISSAGAGLFHVQSESLFKTGQLAGFQESATGMATWTATGLAFGAAGKLFEGRKPSSTPEINPTGKSANDDYYHHFQNLPGLTVGMPAKPTSTIPVGATSETARLYAMARESVGRAEVLALGREGMEGRFGTVFSVSPNGRLLTANHVVDRAVDITVFDAFKRPHQARVVSANEARDLAVLQLSNPESFSAFKPLKLASSAAEAEGSALAFGHPNGWGELFVVPGAVQPSIRSAIQSKYQMHGQESLSGSPILVNGEVQSVLVQNARSNIFEVTGTPIHHATKMLDALPAETAIATTSGVSPKLDLQMIRSFRINDKSAALANLERMFGEKFTDAAARKPDFFHSKVKTVELPTTENHAVTMKMQYDPAQHQIVIRPIAIDGKPIDPAALWPSSRLRVESAQLTVRLNAEGKPEYMMSRNDPTGILQQGFNYRGENNYLATLQQQQMPGWMKLLPPQLRFENLVRRYGT